MFTTAIKSVQETLRRTWATMTSKMRSKQPVPNYQLIEDGIDDIFNIRIEDGDAAGLVYRYGRVRFFEDETNGMLRVKFNYQLVYNPTSLTQPELESIMSVVLDDMLRKENEAQYG